MAEVNPGNDPNSPSDPSSSDSVYTTSKSCRYTDTSLRMTEEEECVGVLNAGAKFLYILPGFDVLGIELRHIQVKGFSKIGNSEEVFDLFIKNDANLCRSYPSSMVIKDIAVIQVSIIV